MNFQFQRDSYSYRYLNVDLNIKYRKLTNKEYDYKVNFIISRSNQHLKTFSIFWNSKEVKEQKELLNKIKDLEEIRLEYMSEYVIWKTIYVKKNIIREISKAGLESFLNKKVVYDSNLPMRPFQIA